MVPGKSRLCSTCLWEIWFCACNELQDHLLRRRICQLYISALCAEVGRTSCEPLKSRGPYWRMILPNKTWERMNFPIPMRSLKGPSAASPWPWPLHPKLITHIFQRPVTLLWDSTFIKDSAIWDSDLSFLTCLHISTSASHYKINPPTSSKLQATAQPHQHLACSCG